MQTASDQDEPIKTILAPSLRPGRPGRWYLTTFATYIAAPCLAAFAVCCVAFAEAHPQTMIGLGAIAAAAVSPLTEFRHWRRSRPRTEDNDSRPT